MKWLTTALLTLVFLSMASSLFAVQAQLSEIDRMILRLDSDSKDKRERAADFLAKTLMPEKISPAVKNRLKVEKNFHVKLALNHALASQGERDALKPLIASLSRTGHLGYVYLKRVTGEDFDWNQNHYQYWYDNTSEAEFKELISERWRRKPMMDEHAEFSSLFRKNYFASMRRLQLNDEGKFVEVEDEKVFLRRRSLTKEEKNRYENLPTTKSWRLFRKALVELDENGNRKEAAKLFNELVKKYPNTYYVDQARDLAEQLEKMIKEDQQFKIPGDFEKLTLKEKIEFHIHCLRNVRAIQFSQPGSCRIWFQGSVNPNDEDYDAAKALLEIGKPAIAHLVDLDDDRRPIRGVGYWRDFVPDRHVLRYSDASEQICDAIESKRK